jgi:hypothetical protein
MASKKYDGGKKPLISTTARRRFWRGFAWVLIVGIPVVVATLSAAPSAWENGKAGASWLGDRAAGLHTAIADMNRLPEGSDPAGDARAILPDTPRRTVRGSRAGIRRRG